MESAQRPRLVILEGAALDALKLLAIVWMVLDHTNEVCLGESVGWMNLLGRGAFPLFALTMAFHLQRRALSSEYVQRLVVFALISQPVFVLAFHNNALNILFTLALGAVVAQWVVAQASWRKHLVCGLALLSFFLKDSIDFDLLGIALPGLLACAIRGERFGAFWALVLLVSLNLDVGDFASLEDGQLVWDEGDWEPWLVALGTVAVTWGSYAFCRALSGPRFLPRYALYAFYPGHLLVLGLWRLWQDGWPVSLLSL